MSCGAMFLIGVRHISSKAFIVCFVMMPAFVMLSAISCTDARTSLPYCLVIADHLFDRPVRKHRAKGRIVHTEQLVRQRLHSLEFGTSQVCSVALCKGDLRRTGKTLFYNTPAEADGQPGLHMFADPFLFEWGNFRQYVTFMRPSTDS